MRPKRRNRVLNHFCHGGRDCRRWLQSQTLRGLSLAESAASRFDLLAPSRSARNTWAPSAGKEAGHSGADTRSRAGHNRDLIVNQLHPAPSGCPTGADLLQTSVLTDRRQFSARPISSPKRASSRFCRRVVDRKADAQSTGESRPKRPPDETSCSVSYPRQREKREHHPNAGRDQHDRGSARVRQALQWGLSRVCRRHSPCPTTFSISSALMPRATMAIRCSALGRSGCTLPHRPGNDGYNPHHKCPQRDYKRTPRPAHTLYLPF